jgi:hypothetical protein
MSISAILNSSSSQYQLGDASNPYQEQLRQLSQDLASGNLPAAQSDLATLQRALSQPAAISASASDSVTQAFNQLATDLKSGDLAAAQKDFSTIQQDLHSQGGPVNKHFHHYRPLSTGSEDSTTQNSLLQDLNPFGQNLASGDLAGAQKACAALQTQAPVSTGGILHQTSPPVLGRPISTR